VVFEHKNWQQRVCEVLDTSVESAVNAAASGAAGGRMRLARGVGVPGSTLPNVDKIDQDGMGMDSKVREGHGRNGRRRTHQALSDRI
jgi:hypothetical protein